MGQGCSLVERQSFYPKVHNSAIFFTPYGWTIVTPCFPFLPVVPVVTPCSPLLLSLPPITLVTPCYPCNPLLPFVTPCYPCFPLLPLVTLLPHCYPRLPLLPLVILVTLCSPLLPLLPLVTLVTPCSSCYPLFPLVTPCSSYYPCYSLFPFVTLVTLCYPLLPLATLVIPCFPLLLLLLLVTPWDPLLPLLPLVTERTQNRAGCSHRQLFRPLWSSSVWRNNQKKLWWKLSGHSDLSSDLERSTPTESRHSTCLLGGKSPSVKLMSRRENKSWPKPTNNTWIKIIHWTIIHSQPKRCWKCDI